MSEPMDLYQAWRSGKVNRMHTMPQLHRENVYEHTGGLLFLILRFWPDCPRHILVAAIMHDLGEVATGDIPAHIKWSNPDFAAILERLESEHLSKTGLPAFPNLDDDEIRILSIFDRAEFCVSCIHEYRLGNLNTIEYYNRSAGKVNSIVESLPQTGPYREIAELLCREICLSASRAGLQAHVKPGEQYHDGTIRVPVGSARG